MSWLNGFTGESLGPQSRSAKTGKLTLTMIQKFNRALAIWRLKRRYKYLLEVDKLMEQFVTSSILDGGSPDFVAASRKQLITLQHEISSKEKMLAFLYSI